MNPLAMITNGVQAYFPARLIVYPLVAEVVSVVYLTN